MDFLTRRFWLIAVPFYWCLAVSVIQRASPISWDGFGPSPTFHWGTNIPAPLPGEYYGNLSIRLQFQYPYWAAAGLLTGLGCGASRWLSRRRKMTGLRRFWIASGTAFTSFLLASAISDFGREFDLWSAPRVLQPDFHGVLLILEISVPPSLLSGAFALRRN